MSQCHPTPLAIEDAQVSARPEASVLRRIRMLVVDDYPDSAISVSMLLTVRGYDCRIACTGGEALEVAAAFDPEVILMDIGLPDISGYDVVRTLRARAPDHPVYIAAITGWGRAQDLARAFAAGFDQHVLKPADATKLTAILQRASAALSGVQSS